MEIRIAHGIQMSLSPIYTFKIQISELLLVNFSEGGRKIVRIIESFELQKFRITEVSNYRITV